MIPPTRVTPEELTELLERVREDLAQGLSPVFDDAHALVAAIEALSDGWQPIETAPKDGTAILIFDTSEAITWRGWTEYYMPPGALAADEVSYRRDDPRLLHYDDKRFAIGYWRPWGGWGNRNNAEPAPTYWMPLPAAPVDAACAATPKNGD